MRLTADEVHFKTIVKSSTILSDEFIVGEEDNNYRNILFSFFINA